MIDLNKLSDTQMNIIIEALQGYQRNATQMRHYMITVFMDGEEKALNLGRWRADTEMSQIVQMAKAQLRLWIPGWTWTVLNGRLHGEAIDRNAAATGYLSEVIDL
jgi:hypothetical protein